MKNIRKLRKLNLQLFADGTGGDGGGAAGATGATAADAGQQTTGVQPAQQGATTAVAGQTDGTDPAKAFEELIKGQYKDQYNSRVEETVKNRVKGLNRQLQTYESAQPIFEILAQRYGVDPKDFAAMAKAAEEDASFFQEEALARGVDVKELMHLKRIERDNASMQRQLAQQRSKEQADRQFAKWIQEAQQVQQVYPGFDLDTELRNEQFQRLLTTGVPMKTAYMVLHNDEIMQGAMQFAAQKAAQQVTDTVIAGAARPAENGTGSQGAVSPKMDPSKLTDKEIMDIRRRASRGEKITLT